MVNTAPHLLASYISVITQQHWGPGRSESNPKGFWFHFAEVEMGLLSFPLANLTLSSTWESPQRYLCVDPLLVNAAVLFDLCPRYNLAAVTAMGDRLRKHCHLLVVPQMSHYCLACVYRWEWLLGLIIKQLWLDPIIHSSQCKEIIFHVWMNTKAAGSEIQSVIWSCGRSIWLMCNADASFLLDVLGSVTVIFAFTLSHQ